MAILPFIEQRPLYDKFKLDEPWDSPHNKALIKEMPPVFVCPEPGRRRSRARRPTGSSPARARCSRTASTSGLQRRHRRDVEHDPGRRGQGGGPLDQARRRARLRPEGGRLALRRRLAPPGRLQRRVRRRLGPLHRRFDRPEPVFRTWSRATAARSSIGTQIPRPPRPAGQPGAGGPLHVDPDMVPTADELKPLLVPRVAARSSPTREGVRIVSRESIPSISSPAVSGVLVALLLPAVQSAREAARRAQCVNNLKQIGLAMHNYQSANNAFPRPAITDKDGKPLLSWRVAILPYIEQQELYNKFKLDEPWDSPHNKALIKEMPPIYVCPSRANVEPGTTTYRVFVGQGRDLREGPGHGDRRYHRRDVEYDHGRRGDRGRSLDQARADLAVRPGGQALALRRRLAAPGRLQRPVRRRLGPVHQEHDRP